MVGGVGAGAAPTNVEGLHNADIDGDGFLTEEEFEAAFPEQDFHTYFNYDGDKIAFAETVGNTETGEPQLTVETAVEMRLFDLDSDGILSDAEIAAANLDTEYYFEGMAVSDAITMRTAELAKAAVAEEAAKFAEDAGLAPGTDVLASGFDPRNLPGGGLLSDSDMKIYRLLKDADDILTYLMDKIRTSAKNNKSTAAMGKENFGKYDLDGNGQLSAEEIEAGGLDPEVYGAGTTTTGSGKSETTTNNPDKTLEECEIARRQQSIEENNARHSADAADEPEAEGTSDSKGGSDAAPAAEGDSKGGSDAAPTTETTDDEHWVSNPTDEQLTAADQNGDGKLAGWEIADAHLDPNKYTADISVENAINIRDGKPLEPNEPVFEPDPTKGTWYNSYKEKIDGVTDFSSSSMGLWVSNLVNQITTFISTIVSLGKTSGDIAKSIDRRVNG